MEPRIQYAKTSDGVNIAYATEGEGPPLVCLVAPGAAHVQRVWARFPNMYPLLARSFRLVWHDPRGAGGTAIEGKLLGDGVLATFGAAREAIACAKACHAAGEGVDLLLHVGIHAGDVIREEGNVFGGAVNVAARISDASEGGETLVSGTVRDLARTSAGVSFEDRGERELKGVSDAVRVWAVGK